MLKDFIAHPASPSSSPLPPPHREEMECGLTFLGLVVMENRLKPQTTPVIAVLKSARIRTVMVTGDNVMTALSVARDCDMIGLNERVVMVTALPPQGDAPARLEWTETEDNRSRGGEVSSGQLDG